MRPGSMYGAGGGVEVDVSEISQHGDELARMTCVRNKDEAAAFVAQRRDESGSGLVTHF